MRIARGVAVLSVASIGVFGLTACSDDSDSSKDTTTVADSTDSTGTTTDDSSADDAGSDAGDLTVDSFNERVTAAIIDAGSYSMSMTTEAAGQSSTTSADVAVTDSTTNMSMVTSIQGMSTEVRIVDAVIYVNLGDMTGGKFVVQDLGDPGNPLAGQFDQLEEQLDPSASLQNFEGAVSSVEKVGEPVDVDGVQAQQYRLVVDTAMLDETIKSQLEASGVELPAELSSDYWVDSEDRPVRVTSEIMGISTDATFSGWGEVADITAPSEDEISTEPLF